MPDKMRYYSTRDINASATFSLKEAAFMGLAPDGGLFVPGYIPSADMEKVDTLAEESFSAMASYLAGLLFDDVPSDIINKVVGSAYDFPLIMRNLGDGLDVLELFHGPTFAFKDFGARFMGRMLGELSKNERLIILTATSGDTGSAVAQGFRSVPGIDVVVLYPKGKVSPIQEAQMASIGENIHAVRVDGNFDDCQRLVKEIFNDAEFRKGVNVTSANSINLLRWIPQSFYYFYAWHLWKKNHDGNPVITVPSGNYGNLTAGILASRMGLPAAGFVAASNANDVVPEYLTTSIYAPRPSVRTVANAMDVGAPSNFERLLWLNGRSYRDIISELSGFSCCDDEIKTAIRELNDRYGYLSDPHGAVGYLAAKNHGKPGFWLGTASPAKFPDVIEDSIGIVPDIPAALAEAMTKPHLSYDIPADGDALRSLILSVY